jgi:hypothetical protein
LHRADQRFLLTAAVEPGRRDGRRGSAGVGVVDTTVGFLIFLTLLLFSAQLLVRLYASSAISSAASHAAEEVAYSPDPAAEVPVAEADARRQLGSFGGSGTTFDWGSFGGDDVVLKVIGRTPAFVPFDRGWTTITRTVVVRIERFR